MPATPSLTVTVISATTVQVRATAGTDTTHIQFDRSWVDNGGNSNDLEIAVSPGNYTDQYFAIGSLSPGNYTVSARARIGSTPSSWVSRGFTVVAPPNPDPSITGFSMASENAITASWSVGNANYMRSSNSMLVYLSGPNNVSQYQQLPYLQSYERSWGKGTDGAGAALIPGARYTIWIAVFNSSGSSFTASQSAVFTKSKPNPFNWTNAKTQNGVYNLLASEWGGLLDKVNEFRGYKGLAQVTFNRNVGSGALSYIEPTASSFNNAVGIINTMSPLIACPTVNSKQAITASLLNTLRDSLNSIPNNPIGG